MKKTIRLLIFLCLVIVLLAVMFVYRRPIWNYMNEHVQITQLKEKLSAPLDQVGDDIVFLLTGERFKKPSVGQEVSSPALTSTPLVNIQEDGLKLVIDSSGYTLEVESEAVEEALTQLLDRHTSSISTIHLFKVNDEQGIYSLNAYQDEDLVDACVFSIKEDRVYKLSDLFEEDWFSQERFAQLLQEAWDQKQSLSDSGMNQNEAPKLPALDQANFAIEDGHLWVIYPNQPELNLPLLRPSFVLNLSEEGRRLLPLHNIGDNQAILESIKNRESIPLDPNKKYVALTFDDGPRAVTTPRLLDILKQYDVPATFFVLGSSVVQEPGILERIYLEGHEIGNHSYSHADLASLSEDNLKKEIESTNRLIEKVTNSKPKIVRCPYGSKNAQVLAMIEANQQKEIFWDVDTLDWQSHAPDKILEIVKRDTKDNSIILMHDIHEESVQATPSVIEYLRGEGYEFVTVSQLEKLLEAKEK